MLSRELQDKIVQWMRYKTELRDGYTEVGLEALIDQTQTQAGKHGDKAVVDLINVSMANGWKGIIWDKLDESQKQTYSRKPEIPKGASGELGEAELEAIQRVLNQNIPEDG